LKGRIKKGLRTKACGQEKIGRGKKRRCGNRGRQYYEGKHEPKRINVSKKAGAASAE